MDAIGMQYGTFYFRSSCISGLNIAQSHLMDVESGFFEIQEIDEAVCWDGGWMPNGTGNRTKEDRIQLHLVFAPKWMIIDMPVKDLIGF